MKIFARQDGCKNLAELLLITHTLNFGESSSHHGTVMNDVAVDDTGNGKSKYVLVPSGIGNLLASSSENGSLVPPALQANGPPLENISKTVSAAEAIIESSAPKMENRSQIPLHTIASQSFVNFKTDRSKSGFSSLQEIREQR